MNFIKKIKKSIAKKGIFIAIISWILRLIKRLCKIIYRNILIRFIKIDENKIFFITCRGTYDCNPKWICEEILKRKLPYKIVWGVRRNADLSIFPKEAKVVLRGSYSFYKELASSKIIIDNAICVSNNKYNKRKKQVLLETWHGSFGIKRFQKPTNSENKKWIKNAKKEEKFTDYLITNSTFEDKEYTAVYWANTPILRYGHARNDILFEKDLEKLNGIKEKIYARYNIKPDAKICLYAPTYRDYYDTIPFGIDYEKLKLALEKRFGGDWVICTRLHFVTQRDLKEYKTSDNVIDINDYPDIQEVLTCIDVGISDYSSWICEYMLTKKPGFLFAEDLKNFEETDRVLYYPLESMPFPLATNNEKLIENILNFEYEPFEKKCEEFLKDKGCVDDGHASERIVDAIERIIKGEKIINSN